MITITALSGPHSGKTREVLEGAGIDPLELLGEFARQNWQWKIDFSSATPQELLTWGRADMVVRVLRALFHGRPVHFRGTTYRAANAQEVPEVAGRVEDAIVYSGFHVVVEADDDTGVTIGTGPTEDPHKWN